VISDLTFDLYDLKINGFRGLIGAAFLDMSSSVILAASAF